MAGHNLTIIGGKITIQELMQSYVGVCVQLGALTSALTICSGEQSPEYPALFELGSRIADFVEKYICDGDNRQLMATGVLVQQETERLLPIIREAIKREQNRPSKI